MSSTKGSFKDNTCGGKVKKSKERIAMFKSKPRDLLKMDFNGFADPFCKLSVDDQHWQSTVSLPRVFL